MVKSIFYSYRNKNHAQVIGLPTGHGKTVIIQLLADMITLADSTLKVLVVCLNPFLANQAKHRVASGNPRVQKAIITYVDLNTFLMMTPKEKTVVIFDEIDQMLGNRSFSLPPSDNGKNMQACFYPSLI